MDTLQTSITRVIYHQPSKWNPSGTPYLIAQTRDGQTVKGEAKKVTVGVNYRFLGSWKSDKKTGQPAFEFLAYDEIVAKDARAIALYLSRNVPGLGQKRAEAITAEFGGETLDILRSDPDRLDAIESIPASTREQVKNWLATNLTHAEAYADLLLLFEGHRVPRKVFEGLISAYGSSAAATVRENPYKLMDFRGIGWTVADAVAVDRCAFRRDSLFREAAALVEILNREASAGHTVVSTPVAVGKACQLTGTQIVPAALQYAIQEHAISSVAGRSDHIGLSRLCSAENMIAVHLRRLSTAHVSPIGLGWLSESDLSPTQRDAVKVLASHAVSVLTGGPGTGKSYTLARFLGSLPVLSWSRIAIAAPMGKAAKRCEELLLSQFGESSRAIQCSTVHRLLASRKYANEGTNVKMDRQSDDWIFGYDASDPLPYDVLVVDEASTLDVVLASKILEAAKTGTRVVIVGDPHQLPSVQAGAFLRDLLASKTIPSYTLTEVRRNAGDIVYACRDIKNGTVPPLPMPPRDLENGKNWTHIECPEDSIAETIEHLMRRMKSFDPLWGTQVVSAVRSKYPFGCDALNTRLSPLLNPLRNSIEQLDEIERQGFVIGDKVVRTANGKAIRLLPAKPQMDCLEDFDWLKGQFEFEGLEKWGKFRGMNLVQREDTIVNGDMGTVLDVLQPDDDHGARVIVKFKWPDRLFCLPLGEASLMQAYALTVHKCQGSGFDCVIVPVSHHFYWDHRTQTGLASRELFYTACSRAQKYLITVGPYSAITAFVSRPTIHVRQTGLQKLLELSIERKTDS